MSDNAVKGFVHSIETFGSVDGPGVRFVIFLSGCAMRCQFCHNPDTWKHDENTVEYTADELLNKALAYRPYWKNKGGITVSGGEPLLQIDFLLDLFKKAKKQGVNTCIDTSANPFTTKEPFYSKWKELMEYTDLLLLDIKHIDNEQHKILTGQPNTNILEMARQLSDMGKPVWIRHVLVPERMIRTSIFSDLPTLSVRSGMLKELKFFRIIHSVCTSGKHSVMTILSRALIPRQKSVLRMRK